MAIKSMTWCHVRTNIGSLIQSWWNTFNLVVINDYRNNTQHERRCRKLDSLSYRTSVTQTRVRHLTDNTTSKTLHYPEWQRVSRLGVGLESVRRCDWGFSSAVFGFCFPFLSLLVLLHLLFPVHCKIAVGVLSIDGWHGEIDSSFTWPIPLFLLILCYR